MTIKWVLTGLVAVVLMGTACDNSKNFSAASQSPAGLKYYISYSTSDTQFLCYAIGDNPYGSFTYAGRILEPVVGWASHHSICAFEGKTYLFYHDSLL